MEQVPFRWPNVPAAAPIEVRLNEPTLWISRLLILRFPVVTPESTVRHVRLHRGLNVLWARRAASEA